MKTIDLSGTIVRNSDERHEQTAIDPQCVLGSVTYRARCVQQTVIGDIKHCGEQHLIVDPVGTTLVYQWNVPEGWARWLVERGGVVLAKADKVKLKQATA